MNDRLFQYQGLAEPVLVEAAPETITIDKWLPGEVVVTRRPVTRLAAGSVLPPDQNPETVTVDRWIGVTPDFARTAIRCVALRETSVKPPQQAAETTSVDRWLGVTGHFVRAPLRSAALRDTSVKPPDQEAVSLRRARIFSEAVFSVAQLWARRDPRSLPSTAESSPAFPDPCPYRPGRLDETDYLPTRIDEC